MMLSGIEKLVGTMLVSSSVLQNRGFMLLRVTTSFPQLGAQTRKQQVRSSMHHL